MNVYDPLESTAAAEAIARYGLWWFEDICEPLDFETLSAVGTTYEHPLAAGEALFGLSEAR